MKTFIAKAFLIGASFLILTSCHRNKTISKSENTQNPAPEISPKIDENVAAILTHLKNNELPFNELSAKLKTKVTSPTLNQSFTTNIRWKKHEKIWLSMSIIGIEGARVLITKDSIKIMDKINNRYILKPLSYIKQTAYVDLTFSDIENLLLGQLIFTDTAKAKYANNPTNITLNADGERFLTDIIFDRNTKNPTSIFVTDKNTNQSIFASYDNYQLQLGKPFSMDRDLKLKSNNQQFEMIAKFQTIEIKENLDFPFYINPNFTIEK